MGNVVDYLNWRGDLTFKQDPFNDVDNLILSELAYVNFDGIVPDVKNGGSITLKEASDKFFAIHSEEELRKVKTFIKNVPFLLRDAAKTKRFSGILLSDYIDIIDDNQEKQFAAFHCSLLDGTTYVTFRGTDDTIVGWKEDFNMSFMMPIPSQIEAVEYLNNTICVKSGKVRLGGHSKGGNLAIYSGVMAGKRVRNRIIEIYNNDGPGFDKTMIESERYQQMLPKIKSIVPHNSVVGMLLEHEEDYMVVKSSQTGIMQHDGESWQILGNKFETHNKISRNSYVLNEALSKWINSMDNEERAKFVEILFSIITASGAKTLSDINGDIFKSANASLKTFNSLDANTRGMLLKIFRSFTGELSRVRRKKVYLPN